VGEGAITRSGQNGQVSTIPQWLCDRHWFDLSSLTWHWRKHQNHA